ncbi:FAD-dependent oxidoreductase [Vibrio caribbeanicus]|uniref:FAD-dependent oxidoreductase n=1 Tax=Vibrio caribbeanicus TaxID=701175 RepID=UPI002283E9B9|nr:FAD-dependent oxidoreductase [Vibrio caribbeanicus]MCY9844248.1 FAD-dependent oxidoreductase [Vibrio caribbeanicus]
MNHKFDVIVVGSGFYGLYIAGYYADKGKSVCIVELEDDAMKRASYNNQARVHNGYHYPRSVLTGLRSRMSFPLFVKEFSECIVDNFDKYYMISSKLGKVTPKQFKMFCNRIEAEWSNAPKSITELVNSQFIDAVYTTKEFAFDAIKLKNHLLNRLDRRNITFLFNRKVTKVSQTKNMKGIRITTEPSQEYFEARHVFNCTYSMINSITSSSNMEIIPLRHELTEMCLVEMPDHLKNIGFTIMCGPFFSMMPFPAKGMHSFSHVRYTPHFEWDDTSYLSYKDPYSIHTATNRSSAFKKMIYDAKRFIPSLEDVAYKESLWEIKTILPRSDSDDSRPILFKPNYQFSGFHCVMGGKIDNVYDVISEIERLALD